MTWVILAQLPAPFEWAGLKKDMYGRGRAFATARFSGPSSVVLLWGTPLPADMGLYSGPAVRDATGDGIPDICVGDDAGILRCFNGPDGTLHWSYSTGGSIYSTPVIEDISSASLGMEVAFTSYDGYLYVLRGSNGTLLWNTYVGYAYNGSPRVYNINGLPGQEVVVATNTGTYVFDGTTGSLVWSNTSVTSDAAVAIADLENNGDIEVIVATNEGSVVALRGTDGSIKWSVSSTCGGYGSAPAVEDVNGDGIMEIFVNFYYNCTCRINGTGSLDWCVSGFSDLSFDGRESVVIGPDINGNGSLDVFTGDYYRNFAAIDGQTGSVIWSRTTTYEVHSHAPITVGDFDMTNPGYEILFANHDGYLDVYSASNGNFLWNISYGGPVGGCCASGYSLLVDVNGDTCVELVVRGEYSAPILHVYRSSNIGSCYLSYDDPVRVEERERHYVSFEVVRGGIRFFEAAGAEIYSVDGARIMVVSKPGLIRLKEGIYLVKQGGKISKVVIK